MAKKVKDALSRWEVRRFKGKSEVIGSVMAKDEEEALKKAWKEYEVPEAQRFKVSVRKMD